MTCKYQWSWKSVLSRICKVDKACLWSFLAFFFNAFFPTVVPLSLTYDWYACNVFTINFKFTFWWILWLYIIVSIPPQWTHRMPSHPFNNLTFPPHLSLLYHYSFAFPRISYEWNHTVCDILCLIFSLITFSYFFSHWLFSLSLDFDTTDIWAV